MMNRYHFKNLLKLILVCCFIFAVNPSQAFRATIAYWQSNVSIKLLSLFAGNVDGFGYIDGAASDARFNNPKFSAIDSSGNLYVSDSGNNTIRKITPAGVVSTLAGNPGVSGSADGTGSAATFSNPTGMTVDSSGNVYVADSFNSTIRKITPAGVVTTFAGATPFQDGTGVGARFQQPLSTAVDSSDNIYVADSDNNTIRKVTPAGVVTTFAGTAGVSGSADGIGTAATFSNPFGLAVDSADNIYVADTYNCTIRKITSAGVVTTLAGNPGVYGSADGIGSAATFSNPAGMTVDSSDNIYVADLYNNTIRKVTSAGVVTTLAGEPPGHDGSGAEARFKRPSSTAVDSLGNVYVADTDEHIIRKITPAGVVTTLAGNPGVYGSIDGVGTVARFYSPTGIAIDSSDNIYVADFYNNTVRKITSGGVVTTLAGTGVSGSADGPGATASFYGPNGISVDGSGNVFVAEMLNHTIRKITPAGVVSTFAGTAGVSGSADGTGSAASFSYPSGLVVDSLDNVYVADSSNHTIRMITPAGVVSTFTGTAGASGSADGTGGTARFYYPRGLAIDNTGNIYVADFYNYTIRKITSAGVVSTFAGSAGLSGSTDGTGGTARFYYPMGVAADSSGNVYIADNYNNTIRKVTSGGVVTTFAGSAPGADGVGAEASFNNPFGVAADSSGNIYVTDNNNNTIRKITAVGVVTTLAGTAGTSGSTDGTGSAARFEGPSGIAVDSSDNLYIADTWNDSIRKITPAGVVTTLAGLAGTFGSADGTGGSARFYYPRGLAIDSSGNIYVADSNNNSIRKVTSGGVVTTFAGANPGADGTGSAASFNLPTGLASPCFREVVV